MSSVNLGANLKILVTGRPGVGKTTLIKRIIDRLKGRAEGFYTEEIKEAGKRLGFRVTTLDGKEAILAHINFKSTNQVGKYGVNLDEFERVALPPLEKALTQENLVVIDEIGKMELFSGRFQNLVKKILDSSAPVLATIGKSAHPFIIQVLKRSDIYRVEITPANRGDLVAQLTRLIKTKK